MTGDVHIIKVDNTLNNNNAETSVDQLKLGTKDEEFEEVQTKAGKLKFHLFRGRNGEIKNNFLDLQNEKSRRKEIFSFSNKLINFLLS